MAATTPIQKKKPGHKVKPGHKKKPGRKPKTPMKVCATCNHLLVGINTNDVTPLCKKRKIKFKPRAFVIFRTDKDINSSTCEKYNGFVSERIRVLEEQNAI